MEGVSQQIRGLPIHPSEVWFSINVLLLPRALLALGLFSLVGPGTNSPELLGFKAISIVPSTQLDGQCGLDPTLRLTVLSLENTKILVLEH